ncbi:MAG: alpha/beta hydrolase [Candidatus Helarchaeota archaeon]
MSTERVFFKSLPDNLKLEGVISYPSKDVNELPGAIVLHPHPYFGGSMNNNVVDAFCEELVQNNMIAFKFNCRGVGRSEGDLPLEKQAIEDTISALNYFETIENLNKNKIFFVGYSWGSKTGLEAIHDEPRIKVLVGISPPIGMFSFDFLKSSKKPKILTLGNFDQLISKDLLLSFYDKLQPPKELILFDTDHFYVGVEKAVTERTLELVKKLL